MSNTPPSGTTTVTLTAYLMERLHDAMWFTLKVAAKALIILFIWNGWLAPVWSLNPFEFGHAFGLTLMITVLFSNLNSHTKFQTRHLFDIRSIMYQLLVNQFTQTNDLKESVERLEKQLAKQNVSLDIDKAPVKEHNIPESEK